VEVEEEKQEQLKNIKFYFKTIFQNQFYPHLQLQQQEQQFVVLLQLKLV
jgi:hypothetical protein